MSEEVFHERVRYVISHALANLSDEECSSRIAYCRDHNEHGVRLFSGDQDDVLDFRWGGRTLALVRRADLLSEGVLWANVVADVPDTPEGLEL